MRRGRTRPGPRASSSGRVVEHASPEEAPPLRVNGGESAAVHVLVVVVGLSEEDVEAVVRRTALDRGVVPVFLTDSGAFAPFRTRRLPFEYLPPPGSDPDLDWRLYRLRRLALVRRKWQPARIVAFGGPASALVRGWLQSPFEDDGIVALTGTTPRQ